MSDPIIIDPKLNDLRTTFEITFGLVKYEGEDIQVKLPANHDISSASIAADDVVLSTQTNAKKWASSFTSAGGLTDNGGSAAIEPGNFGLLSVNGAARTTFAGAGGLDVTVRLTVIVPTGRIGRLG